MNNLRHLLSPKRRDPKNDVKVIEGQTLVADQIIDKDTFLNQRLLLAMIDHELSRVKEADFHYPISGLRRARKIIEDFHKPSKP